MVRAYNSKHSPTESQSDLDDDFEAFKALTKTSLHATVAVSSLQNDRSSNRAVCHTALALWILLITWDRKRMLSEKGKDGPMILFLGLEG